MGKRTRLASHTEWTYGHISCHLVILSSAFIYGILQEELVEKIWSFNLDPRLVLTNQAHHKLSTAMLFVYQRE